jgi:uncharacterized membrane protein
MYFVRGFVLALHIFGVIFWLGGLLMVTSLLARVPEEVGLPKERFLGAARGLFESTVNLGAAISIMLGLLLILLDQSVGSKQSCCWSRSCFSITYGFIVGSSSSRTIRASHRAASSASFTGW